MSWYLRAHNRKHTEIWGFTVSGGFWIFKYGAFYVVLTEQQGQKINRLSESIGILLNHKLLLSQNCRSYKNIRYNNTKAEICEILRLF